MKTFLLCVETVGVTAEEDSTRGLEIAVGILAVAVAAVLVVAAVFYRRLKR